MFWGFLRYCVSFIRFCEAWFIEFLAELPKKGKGGGEAEGEGRGDKEPSLREDNVLNCKENQSIIMFSLVFFSSK